jgi:hypothetical protein
MPGSASPESPKVKLIYFMAVVRSGAPHFIRDRKEEFSYFDLDPE